jgi:PKD repeat protein
VSRAFSCSLLALISLALVSCDKMPLTAPTGSTIFLTANTTRLPINGTAEITATVVEMSGTPPQNGTLVTFTASLGTIEPAEARTSAGRVVVRFVAGSQSGTARIGASSGDARATGDTGLQIQIGGAGVTGISLRAEPGSAAGTVTIIAVAVDEAGNGVAGAPVSFSADTGQISPGLVTTDANGEARTTLTTSTTTVVTARVGQISATLTIQPASITLAVTTTNPEVGVPVNFTVTPAANASLREVVVDFGDGTPPLNLGPVSSPRAFSHTYTQRGTFTVTATATSPLGVTSVASVVVTVNNRAPLPVTITASPSVASLAATQGLVSFTATATPPVGAAIQSVFWDFGDNTGDSTTGLTINHRYNAPGTYVVTVLVVSTDGREGNASTTVRVTP